MRVLNAFLFVILFQGLTSSAIEDIEGVDKCHTCLFELSCLELIPEDAKNGLVKSSMNFGAIKYLDDVCSCVSSVDACLTENSCGYKSYFDGLKKDLGCGEGNIPNWPCLICTYQAFQNKCKGIVPENKDLDSTSDISDFLEQLAKEKGPKVCSCVNSIDECRKDSCSFEAPKHLDSFLGEVGCSADEDQKQNDNEEEKQNNDENNDEEQENDDGDDEKQKNDNDGNDDDEDGSHNNGGGAANTENSGDSISTENIVTPVVAVVVVGSILGGIVLAIWIRRRGNNTTTTARQVEWRHARQP